MRRACRNVVRPGVRKDAQILNTFRGKKSAGGVRGKCRRDEISRVAERAERERARRVVRQGRVSPVRVEGGIQ